MKSESIFEHNIGGRICYTREVEGRLRIVKECRDIESLKAAFDIPCLQKTVEKAISTRIRRLEREADEGKS